MMKMKNLAGIATFALAALAAPFASHGVGTGDIFEIRPVDESGASILAPTEPLDAGSTLRFVVRLAAPTVGSPAQPGNPFRLVHIPGLNTEATDWALNRPAMGVFVNGKLTMAYLDDDKFPYLKAPNFTDFVFSYTVKSGDFALPVRLANSDGTMVTQDSSDVKYYVSFGNGILPAWKVDDSTASGGAATREAVFQYGNPGYPFSQPEMDRWSANYDLTQCNFNIRTIAFDEPADPFTPGYWRTVPQGEAGYKDLDAPRLVLTGSFPTNSVKLYLWSEDESAVYLAAGKERDVHVTAGTTEKRRVLEIDSVADYVKDINGYEFQIAGADAGKGKAANIVLSAFPDFNYTTGALTPERIADYLFVPVLCGEPSSAKVTIKPGRSVIAAKHNYLVYETELSVSFNKPYGEDVWVEIVPSFNDEEWAATTNWWEYIRLSGQGDADPTLETPTANPKVLIPAGSKYPTQFEDGTTIDSGKIYLYALRTDEHVTGAHKMTFAVKTDNEHAQKPVDEGGIEGWDKAQSALTINGEAPMVVEMFDGAEHATTAVDSKRTLKIKISDVYADMVSEAGYEIWYVLNVDSATETTFKKLDGLYKPGAGDVLYKVGTKDELPTVVYKEDGEISSLVKIKAPVSGTESAEHAFTMTVTIPKGYVVETSDGTTEFDEGASLQLKVTLDEQNKFGDMYAYLKPRDTLSKTAVDCAWLAEAGKTGIPMKQYDQVLATGLKLQIIDGDGSSLGSTLTYEVVFCSTPEWNEEKIVSAYRAKNILTLTTHNVIPSIGIEKGSYVQMNGNSQQRVSENGGTIGAKFPMDFTQRFAVKVYEPGTADKTAEAPNQFQVRWFFTDEDGTTYGPNEAPMDSANPGIRFGNPDNSDKYGLPEWTGCTFDFPAAGKWTVTVELKDKDMDDFGNGDIGEMFTFHVEVVDQPTVTVETDGSYMETDSADNGGEASIALVLALNSYSGPLTVNLKIEPNEAGSSAPGIFKLVESTTCVRKADGSYDVTVPKKTTRVPLAIKTLDGTRDSKLTGFKITPKMISEDIIPNSGNKKACDYYVGVETTPVKVTNVEPQLDPELDVYPVPGTNVFKTALGKTDEAITWSFTDVTPDFERPASGSLNGGAGVKVEFKGGGGWGPKWYSTLKEALADGAKGFYPDFKQSGSGQTVKLIITDPDNGVVTVMWTYDVAPSKSMQAVAHGPASGNGGSHGKRYRSAGGIGEGRIWAEAKSSISTRSFESTINCGLDKTFKIYGYGYKVDDLDDGKTLHYPDGTPGYYLDRDTPIDGSGANLTGGGSAYKYSDADRDSFLYTWLQISRGEGDDSALTDEVMGGATAPEYWQIKDSGSTVGLPTEQDDDGNYDASTVEAIFAKEFLPSDNMGDINADGIPDIYVDKYKFDVMDETGALTGDDLRDLNFTAGSEEKGSEPYCVDYLPAFESSPYSTLIPGLAETWVDTGKPFIPRLKIRGFDESDALAKAKRNDKFNTVGASALNDAPELAKITGVLCDRVYTNPREDKKSTLNYVEWLAWCEYATAQGWDVADKANWTKWSPERPTDPTKPDTDGDGMTDGYEYYFWYLAHVGYIDANGNHRYLQGRAYDPRNPGEGRLITSEEIAAAFDPLAPGSFSKLTDTDNDGLDDLTEFMIGTNPIDFDTDGDGLPDGWEIMIAGLDPTTDNSKNDSIGDTKANYDGDAMAISSYELEKNVLPSPLKPEHAKRVTFAIEAVNGDTDGAQWYAMTAAPKLEVAETIAADAWWTVSVDGVDYCATNKPVTVDGRLAAGITVFTIESYQPPAEEEPEEGGDEGGDAISAAKEEGDEEEPVTELVRGYPVRLAAATPIAKVVDGSGELKVYKIAEEVAAEEANACWIYGKYGVDKSVLDFGKVSALRGEVAETAADYGCLAIARQLAVPAGAIVYKVPSDERDVAYLHYLCYQEFGFDPRTAWSANSPLASRWEMSIDGEAVSGVLTTRQGGYAGIPTRTRAYTAYDEFLVCSFFWNNEGMKPGYTAPNIAASAPDWAKTWRQLTTNPQGPIEGEESTSETKEGAAYYGRASTEGADTDLDGVPDGWELYVMSGPKKDGAYVFAPPYNGFETAFDSAPKSYWSPFVPEANSAETANPIYTMASGVVDTLTELREFSGTDSCAHYAGGTVPYSKTILLRTAQVAGANNLYKVDDSKWLNKFFPTDPWNNDTDGDGIVDSGEASPIDKGGFVYGTPADDGTLWSIPGGGLNPCTVDTDLDGLPDAWEAQFKGVTVYAGEDANFAKKDGTEIGNPLQGLVDGMDGTVKDASTYPNNNVSNDIGFKGCVNRDYDHDGLENWQEYLTGTMRCWRYDDPVTPFTAFDKAIYFETKVEKDEESGEEKTTVAFNAEYAAKNLKAAGLLETDDVNEFWYKTLVDVSSPVYNPHLVMGTSSGAQYFSRIENGWDIAYYDKTLGASFATGAYYWFPNRVDGNALSVAWGQRWAEDLGIDPKELAKNYSYVPSKYPSCSPIDPDSDHDGMDDYYELFHGMNPLLGKSGVVGQWMSVNGRGGIAMNTTGFDLVYDALYATGKIVAQAWGENDDDKNFWQRLVASEGYAGKKPRGTGFDFEVYPWLTGLAEADPDGDGTMNQEESIMGSVAPETAFHHSDPTPLWMTDSSYSNSFTRLFYRLPLRTDDIDVPARFTYNEVEYKTCDYAGIVGGILGAYKPDLWSLTAADKMNFIASFEENEGFDTDHDGLSDSDETAGKYRGKTDSTNFDSPRRRQAMYFQGKEKPSILQTMPFVKEKHPLVGMEYPDDMSFLHYTVECWVKAETLDAATVIERANWMAETNPGDEEFLRCNFSLGIKGGKWYTKYDYNDTTKRNVELASDIPATTEWTHLAATYDGVALVLYVNGQSQGSQMSGAQPAYGSGAAWVRSWADIHGKGEQTYWKDDEYPLNAIVLGASFKTLAGGAKDGKALDVTQGAGWEAYENFFKGYVDEVRVWDGVRTANEIRQAMGKRFTAEDIEANRSAFYEEWSKGGANDDYRGRYAKDENGNAYKLPAELRYHWAFDSIFGAISEDLVATAPQGFNFGGTPPEKKDARALLSRPEGYEIAWWKTVLDGYTDTVYGNKAWIEWVPNTVTHMPRFDGTTLDSAYWSENFKGSQAGTYKFARAAEPVSRWTQYVRNGLSGAAENGYATMSTRHYLMDATDKASGDSTLLKPYSFAARHLNQTGDDLLPLGGAYVKQLEDMWDGQGASSNWEIGIGNVDSADGLPLWWIEYARDEYNSPEAPMWDTLVTWPESTNENRTVMTAGEAYMRDLARGYVSNESGDYAITDGSAGNFTQTYDMDGNGIPDWWEELYNIVGEAVFADSDNDGLSNYAEYLLSEVFEFKGVRFSPINPRSIDPYTPDYFYKVGELYAGEIFTDHDLMNDLWEDKFDNSVVTRLLWDADKDFDLDGWSNRSEDRAGTDPSKFSHASIESSVVADYPVPMIHAKVTVPKTVSSSSPIIIQSFTGADFAQPDATWQTSTGSGSFAKEKVIGMNPGGTRHYYLSPGSIAPGTVSILFNDENAVTYTDQIDANGRRIRIEGVITGSGWQGFVGDKIRADGGVVGDLIHYTGKTVGWINYETGEIELWFDSPDLEWAGVALGTSTFTSGDTTVTQVQSMDVDLTRALVKITWTASLISQGSRAEFYLSDADSGHVREGKNTFVAFADDNGDGQFTPGEAYGLVRDVDVSWSNQKVDIELTATSPVTPRITLWGGSSEDSDSGRSSSGQEGESSVSADRIRTVDEIYTEIKESVYAQNLPPKALSNALENLSWMQSNVIATPEIKANQDVHVRVVRWLVDGNPVWLCGVEPRVVYDKVLNSGVAKTLTEGDFLNDGAFDLDWQYLQSEVVNAYGTRLMELPIAEVDYLVVIGDGVTAFMGRDDTNNVVKALSQVVARKFGTSRVIPQIVSPSATAGQVVRDANPTFKWTVSEPAVSGYTAFKVQVANAAGKMVFDSGVLPAPAHDADGNYVWKAPLYVGDVQTNGLVYANDADYTWKVSMYNSKYKTDSFSTVGMYLQATQTNGLDYGSARVAVRYYGPSKSYEKATIRVRAYESPDFTGTPVAAGYVALPNDAETGVSVSGKPIDKANCTLIGLPKGTYYLQAFIDSNGNGVCDKWESMGYLCDRSGNTADWLNPVGIKFDDKVGFGDLAVIYIEDTDTDGDSLPDAWEFAANGDLTTQGVAGASVTEAGEFIADETLTGKLKVLAGKGIGGGLAGEIEYILGSSKAFAALLSGYEPSELEADVTLKVAGFAFDAATQSVKIDFDASVTKGQEVVNTIYTIRSGDTLRIQVYHKDNLADAWEKVGPVQSFTVTKDAVNGSMSVPMEGIDTKSGFFTVGIER